MNRPAASTLVQNVKPMGQPRDSGFESLAKKNLGRPRSASVKDEGDLFDADSEVFSAFDDSKDDDSSILSSKSNSPQKRRNYTVDNLRDIDNDDVDVNLISLTANNKEFQRLVQEAKEEKARDSRPIMPNLTIDTEQALIEEEKKDAIGLDLPKPLPKP